MGIVLNNIPTVSTQSTESITTINSPTITTIEVLSVDKICTEGSSSSRYENTHSIDSTVYTVFNMKDDMKHLKYPNRIKNEFDLFIEYGTLKTNNEEYNTVFDSLNNYLGTIGVTNEFC